MIIRTAILYIYNIIYNNYCIKLIIIILICSVGDEYLCNTNSLQCVVIHIFAIY